jgi:signal transduction histidine kinase
MAASGRQLTRGLRNALVDIYPPTLHREGLAPALADLAESVGRRGVAVDVDVPSDLALAPDVEALLFRIGQETMRNVVSHAGAEHVQVGVSQTDGRVRMVVSDDGRGFDATAANGAPSPEGHFGLRAMQSLTEDAGGTFAVRSHPGEGTSVEVEVPSR